MSGKLWSSGGGSFDKHSPGRFRYLLWRELADLFAGEGTLLFVMLNPSTADERRDDATIRRCCRFAVDLGYRRLEVVNLYALRATDPAELALEREPVGPENDRWISEAAGRARHVVAAWGDSEPRGTPRRADAVLAALLEHGPVFCLGRTRGGLPRHPLYVRATARLDLYRPGNRAGANPPCT